MAKKKGSWEQQILNQIQEEERATYLGQNHPELDPDEHPNFKVFEFSPNRHLDGDKRYYLSGPDWSIMQQASHVKALHDLLANRLGYGFTFKDWWKQWEAGFTFGINRTGTTGLKTNYPFKKVGNIPGWRTDKTTRPGYLEWKSPNAKANPYYRVIEYWPDRSETDKSYVLSGSDIQIIQQILNIEYSGQSEAVASDGSETMKTGGLIQRAGRPQIVLLFLEDYQDIEPGYEQVKGRVSFRLMNKAEISSDEGSTLTVSDLKQYLAVIKREFWIELGRGYVWRKGKEMISYCDWKKGYQLQLFCRNKTDGVELVKKVLSIQGHTYDASKLNHSVNENPTQAYPTVPEQINVLGHAIRAPRRRPIADARFRAAKLLLRSLPMPIYLIDFNGRELPNVDKIGD